MASQSYFRAHALSDEAEHAQALLQRYPDLSEAEVGVLIRTFAGLPLLDFGLMAADEQLSDKLEAFYADHGETLRPTVWESTWAIAVPALIVVTVLIYWAVT